ncbi:MAG TPA: hypothetical protein VGV38_00615 [Pyrinomonadaceae bacterium]|nr:hypothetical protein [Pyrinomonadaceae bacterium]
MYDESEELRRRFALLRDEELLKILTARRVQYRQAALDVAAEELTRRGVAYTPPPAGFTPHVYARPAHRPKGLAYWFGFLLIGCLCLMVAEWIDYLSLDPSSDFNDPLNRFIFIVLISVACGRLMRWWERVD